MYKTKINFNKSEDNGSDSLITSILKLPVNYVVKPLFNYIIGDYLKYIIDIAGLSALLSAGYIAELDPKFFIIWSVSAVFFKYYIIGNLYKENLTEKQVKEILVRIKYIDKVIKEQNIETKVDDKTDYMLNQQDKIINNINIILKNQVYIKKQNLYLQLFDILNNNGYNKSSEINNTGLQGIYTQERKNIIFFEYIKDVTLAVYNDKNKIDYKNVQNYTNAFIFKNKIYFVKDTIELFVHQRVDNDIQLKRMYLSKYIQEFHKGEVWIDNTIVSKNAMLSNDFSSDEFLISTDSIDKGLFTELMDTLSIVD